MDQRQIIEIVQQAIFLMIKLSGPVMLIGLLVGLTIALFQALTQIQEMTLAFVPKIIAILFAIFLFFPYFMVQMADFMSFISDQIIAGDVTGGSS